MKDIVIKKITIDKIIESAKLIWDTMNDFKQIPEHLKEMKNQFIMEIVEDSINEDLILFGAFFNNKVVGVIGIDLDYINYFFVKKEYQNNKIGKKLMNTALNYLEENHFDKIYLDASSYAHDIYKKLGFFDEYEYNECKEEYPMVYEIRRNRNGIHKEKSKNLCFKWKST